MVVDADALRDIMTKKLFTQVVLANESGLSLTTISRALRYDQVGLRSVKAIAEALGIDPVEIISEK